MVVAVAPAVPPARPLLVRLSALTAATMVIATLATTAIVAVVEPWLEANEVARDAARILSIVVLTTATSFIARRFFFQRPHVVLAPAVPIMAMAPPLIIHSLRREQTRTDG